MSTVKTSGAKGAREPREPKLGVLGGMGPQATQVFYQYVLDRTEASCDQEHLPALILSDTGVPDRTASILTGNTEPMYQRLLADARLLEECGVSFEHMPSGIDTMTVFVHQSEFEEFEQSVIAGIHRAVQPDFIDLESDLALIAVVGRGMKATRGTAGRIFSALAHAHVNVKMIDQGSSEWNVIVGVRNEDFEKAIKAIYDIFVTTQL